MGATGVTYRHWTADDEALLIRLRETERLKWKDIGKQLHRTAGSCSTRYGFLREGGAASGIVSYACSQPIKSLNDIHEARLTPLARKSEAEREARTAAALAREQAELSRGLITSTYFGDPPPGWSALDRKRKVEHA